MSQGNTPNAYRYTGQQSDADSTLLYLRARYYEPNTGRFITQDPYKGDRRIPMTLNSYLYCLNNPLKFTDPSGLIPEDMPLMTAEEHRDPEFCEGYKRGLKLTCGAIVFLIGNLIILIPTGGSGPIVAGSLLAGAGGPTVFASGALSAAEIEALTGLTLATIGAKLMGSSASGGGGGSNIRTAENLKKKANDLVRGGAKHAKNYPSDYANYTYEEIVKMSSTDKKARRMKEFIEESLRLSEKYSAKPK